MEAKTLIECINFKLQSILKILKNSSFVNNKLAVLKKNYMASNCKDDRTRSNRINWFR